MFVQNLISGGKQTPSECWKHFENLWADEIKITFTDMSVELQNIKGWKSGSSYDGELEIRFAERSHEENEIYTASYFLKYCKSRKNGNRWDF